jgi:hypothetical protein
MRNIKSGYEVRNDRDYSKTRNIQFSKAMGEKKKAEEQLQKRLQERYKQLKNK